jgi:crotonobetainyl-CoA:carnitine CoA-transferase CaiB-like acyl-CoA transferase
MDRMKLGYESCKAINPGLVYVSATGFGQTGPDKDEKGYDTIFQALSGIMAMTGHPDGPPAKTGIPVADLTSGLWITIAALVGLVGRSSSGEGCHVDVSMMDVQISLLALSAARIFALNEEPQRTGTEHPGRVPSAAFECADGRWLHISGSDQHWQPLCRALGMDEMAADQSLNSNAERVRRRQDVMAVIRTAVSQFDRDEVIKRLKVAKVPVGEVRSVREALDSDQSKFRELVQTFTHPTEGEYQALRTPIRLSGYENPVMAPPPLLGADTTTILSELLGMTRDDITELHSEGII